MLDKGLRKNIKKKKKRWRNSLRFFLCELFFKVFIEFVTVLPLFYVLFFGHKPCGIYIKMWDIKSKFHSNKVNEPRVYYRVKSERENQTSS